MLKKIKEIFFKWHVFFYGLICLAANMLAVCSGHLANFPLPVIQPLNEWTNFLRTHSLLTNFISFFCYGIPIVLCILYRWKGRGLKKTDRKYIEMMVHLPGAFALRGITGWISDCTMETVCLLYLQKTRNLDITFIMISSISSYIMLSIFSFTVTYFSLETLNRNVVLPHLYPEGNISGTARMSLSSIKNMFLFYFFSAALFPTAFLGIRLFYTKRYKMEIPNYYDFLYVTILLSIGLILTFLFIRFFQKPLKKLTDSANEISKGNYDCRTVICSNDEMGVLGDSFNAMASSLKEKEFMRDTFGKIVTPQVRDYLLEGNVALGGEKLDVTVMFCDIRGFTSLSENMEPEKVVSLLNEYFTGLEKCITRHGGVINKYIGDAVMALFGAPVRSTHHARDAFEAALDMRKELSSMNKNFVREGLPEIRFGIGLHSGPVLAGNIGASKRMEYTVIGDTVNTASRIEGLCKQYKKDLLISLNTAELLDSNLNENISVIGQRKNLDDNSNKAGMGLIFVDEAEIRGRREKVKLFTN